MPAATLPRAVDAGNLAIIPSTDPRYTQLDEAERVAGYLGRFKTPFGAQLRPAVIIHRMGTRGPTDVDLATLRNVVAVSSVVMARAERCRGGWQGEGPLFTDFFDFYRIHLKLQGPGLLIDTEATLGTSFGQEEFSGQPSPVYVAPQTVRPDLDQYLLDSLLALWKRRPRSLPLRQRKVRFLRSLELAFSAMRAPAANLRSRTDQGVTLALWVAAFETLAQSYVSGGDGVAFAHVSEMIRAVPWRDRRLCRARYPYDHRSTHRRGRAKPKVTKPVRVYGRLYRARNLVMHGEELPRGGIEPGARASWGPLHLQAAVLYRCVLLHEVARAGFGTYPAKRARTRGPMSLEAWTQSLVADRDAMLAHRRYEKALIKNYAR